MTSSRNCRRLVRGFGFDSFMYATANYHLRPDNDERMYVFTTLPRDWVIRYDQCAYVECDPRVVASFDNALPLLWDQASERTAMPGPMRFWRTPRRTASRAASRFPCTRRTRRAISSRSILRPP